jgi:hypothetical protein
MAARMAGFNPAMEAAIQPFYATPVWRRDWMAGSRPGHDGAGQRSYGRVKSDGGDFAIPIRHRL